MRRARPESEVATALRIAQERGGLIRTGSGVWTYPDCPTIGIGDLQWWVTDAVVRILIQSGQLEWRDDRAVPAGRHS